MLKSVKGRRHEIKYLGGSAPERGYGAPLEPLAQLGDAQGGVGTVGTAMHIVVDAAELVPVAIQAAKGRRGVSMSADIKANARGWFERRAVCT